MAVIGAGLGKSLIMLALCAYFSQNNHSYTLVFHSKHTHDRDMLAFNRIFRPKSVIAQNFEQLSAIQDFILVDEIDFICSSKQMNNLNSFIGFSATALGRLELAPKGIQILNGPIT